MNHTPLRTKNCSILRRVAKACRVVIMKMLMCKGYHDNFPEAPLLLADFLVFSVFRYGQWLLQFLCFP